MNKIVLTALLLILTSCSNGLFGESNKPKHPGKRISILAHDIKLTSDQNLKDTPIRIPQQINNSSWYSSDVNQNNLLPQNLSLGSSLALEEKISVGKLSCVPIISNNILYTLSQGKLIATNLDSKSKPLWITSLVKKDTALSGGGMLMVSNIIFVTFGQRDVVAIDATNGKEIWRHKLSNIARAAPAFYNGRLFVLTIDNKLYNLRADTGELLWVHEGVPEIICSEGAAAVTAIANVVLVPHTTGQLYVLNMNDGSEMLEVDLTRNLVLGHGFSVKDIDTTPIIDGDNAYILSNEGVLISLNLNTGEKLWTQENTGMSEMWLAGDFLYTSSPATGEIAAIYKKNGGIKWVNKIPLEKQSLNFGPIMAGNNLVFVSAGGVIFFISPYDGSIISEIKASNMVAQKPIIVNNKLYLIGKNGVLTVWK